MTEIKVGDYVRYKAYRDCQCGEPQNHFGWVCMVTSQSVQIKTLLNGKHLYGREDIEHVPEG